MHNIAERGKQASVDGFAHEHIAAGIFPITCFGALSTFK
jgi:hypothetical protein